MTRKHFTALADFARDANLTRSQALKLARTLQQFNAQFDTARFLEACGVEG